MPFIEFEDKRARRLIREAVLPLLDRLKEQPHPEFPVDVWISSGGNIAQQLLVQSIRRNRPLRKAWHGGNELKAIRLVRLFSLATVSRYYWYIDDDDPVRNEADKLQVRYRAAWAVSELCGEDPSYSLPEFVKVDMQFRADELRNADRSRPEGEVFEKPLLWDLAMELCDVPTGLNLRSARIPLIEYSEAFSSPRDWGPAPEDVLMLSGVLTAATEQMAEYVRNLSAGEPVGE